MNKRGTATARALWRIVWANVRHEAKDGGHRPTRGDRARRVALDAWHARRDGVPGDPWPGIRGRLLATGWRPLPPLPLP
jgi:hypothetical protein